MERIDEAGDERLSDYRHLKDTAARRRLEGDELFIAEGPVAIERLIASSHRVRSVLVSRQKYDRMADVLDLIDAPVFTVDKALLHEIVGFDLHRGAIAAADGRTLEQVLPDLWNGGGRAVFHDGGLPAQFVSQRSLFLSDRVRGLLSQAAGRGVGRWVERGASVLRRGAVRDRRCVGGAVLFAGPVLLTGQHDNGKLIWSLNDEKARIPG